MKSSPVSIYEALFLLVYTAIGIVLPQLKLDDVGKLTEFCTSSNLPLKSMLYKINCM